MTKRRKSPKVSNFVGSQARLNLDFLEDRTLLSAGPIPLVDPIKIQVLDPTLTPQLLNQGARPVTSYGSVQLLEVSATQAQALASRPGVEVHPEYDYVMLNAGYVDTTEQSVRVSRLAASGLEGSSSRLVQFVGPVQPAWYDALLNTGVRVVTYIPSNAYLVYGDSSAMQNLESWASLTSYVQWVGDYQNNFKIDPRLTPSIQAQSAVADVPVMLSIQLVDDSVANARTMQWLDQWRVGDFVQDERALGYRNIIVELPFHAIRDIVAQQPDVVSIQPYVIPKKMDEAQSLISVNQLVGNAPTSGLHYLTYLASKGFTQAQFDASAFSVVIVDDGIDDGTTDPNHFALQRLGDFAQGDRLVFNRPEGSANDANGADGHGNLNAHIVGGYVPLGTVGGTNFNSSIHTDANGFKYGVGVAPFVYLGGAKIFDPNFTNPDFEDMESRNYASGARISSNSWGADVSGAYNSDSQRYDALVRDAQPSGSAVPVAGNQEMVIVFAAGNAGSGAGTVGSPGSGKNVITVGASENVRAIGGTDASGVNDSGANNVNEMATFSSRGPTADGRIKPDIVAPGTHVTGGVWQENPVMTPTGDADPLYNGSVVSGGPGGADFFPSGQQYYTASSGTSHSTPAVAGGAALIRQEFINFGMTPPSPAMTKASLMASARYLTTTGGSLYSNTQGMGGMNLDTFFDFFVTPTLKADQSANNTFTSSGQTRTYSGIIPDATKPLRITLAWTDAPGPTSGSAYINNLDLEVTVNGTPYKGNVFSGANSVTGGSADFRNNAESVFLPAGVTGTITITIRATNIAGDGVPNFGGALDQDFALVAYNVADSMTVTTTVPAVGSVIATQPTSFTVNLSSPVNSATVDASDLVVNGIPATNASYTAGQTQIIFSFATSPVTVQGLQSMVIAAGAFNRIIDSAPLTAFNGNFRYDVLPMQVVSTNPTVGAVVTVPMTTLDINLNEPVATGSVANSDLTLSQGTVTGFSFLNSNQTIRFNISGLVNEGALMATIAAGALTDVAGNPSLAFAGNYSLDFGTTAFPTPLTQSLLPGSLIYRQSANGSIISGDTDSFTIHLEGGQKLSLYLDTAATLLGQITLLDPSNGTLATASSASNGKDVVLQDIAVTNSGTYTIVVSGGGTVGSYTLQLLLNAHEENELHDGANNTMFATAENLDDSFVTLGNYSARGAAVGVAEVDLQGFTPTALPYEFLDISTTGTMSTVAVGDNAADTLTAAQLGDFVFPFYGTNYSSLSFSTNGLITFTGATTAGFNGDLSTSPSQPAIAVVWDDLVVDNSGTGAASRNIFWQLIGSGASQRLVIQWNNARPWAFGWYFSAQAILSRDGTIQFNYNAALPAFVQGVSTVGVKAAGTSNPNRLLLNYNGVQPLGTFVAPSTSVRLSPIIPPMDYYSFSLVAGESSTIALKSSTAGVLSLRLYDAAGNLLANGLNGTTNFDLSVRDFHAPTTGLYYALVTANGTAADYNLVVTRNAGFDSEANNNTTVAQRLQTSVFAGQRDALGYVESGGVDLYAITLTQGDSLHAHTTTPGGGVGEFTNNLDPRLRLLNANGTLLLQDDNSSGDSRNASFDYTVPIGGDGVYYLEVAGSNATIGEYVLHMAGVSSTLPVFQVFNTTLPNGANLTAVPTSITVTFNDDVLLSSIQAGDLQIDGVDATAVAVIGPRTLNFTLPGLVDGSHNITMASGSIVDLQGSPLQSYNSSFFLDHIAPSVIATSIAANATLTPGNLTYQVTFSEPMNTANFNSADLSLRGTLRGVNYSFSNGSYDASGTVLTLNYLNLPDDIYTLTLTAGTTGGTNFTDRVGVALDGEFSGAFPSGNGTAGGNFVINFNIDQAANESLCTTLSARGPFGSAIYDFPGMQRTIAYAGDTDKFNFTIDGNQTLSVMLQASSGLLSTLTLLDPLGVPVRTVSSTANGLTTFLQNYPANMSGMYSLQIAGANGTTGIYTAQVTLNAALEIENHLSIGNNNIALAESLDSFFNSLGGGANRASMVSYGDGNGFPDYFSFTLNAGDSVTVSAAGGFPVTGLELKDSANNTLAIGTTGLGNVNLAVVNFLATTAGTYYAVPSNGFGNTYTLIVTRNGTMDIENNDSITTAFDLASTPVNGEQRVAGYVDSGSVGTDLYRVNLSANATLQLETFTPGDGPNLFANTLNPRVRVLDAAGTQIAIDDNSSSDGRNAKLSYLIPSTGTYYVEVSAGAGAATVGEYILSVVGANYALADFRVAATTPANGASILTAPTTLVVTFSDSILVPTLQASDLIFDGITVTAFTQSVGNSVTFTLPGGITPGIHNVSIAEGAILDIQGTPIRAYNGTFNVDVVAPRIIAATTVQNGTVSPGNLTYQVTFNEPMKVANLDSADFSLRGNFRATNYSASTYSLDVTGTVLTLNYTNLPDDNYTLTLVAGATSGFNFTDLAGNALDGEFNGTLPSGNGIAGGNFVINFEGDYVGEAITTPTSTQPLGNLVYSSSAVTRYLTFTGDIDTFTVNADPGQSITVVVTPIAGLQPTIDVRDPSNNSLGSATASAVTRKAVLNTVPATQGGIYTIAVGDAGSAMGNYSIQVFLNAALELESNQGATNNTRATAQSLTPGPSGVVSVLGQADVDAAYTAASVTPEFLDISSTGTASTTAIGDNATASLSSGNLAGFTISFYGTTYNGLSFSTNGLITFTSANTSGANSDFTSTPTQASIAPLWDDLFVENTGTGAASRRVYWQVVGAGPAQQLIIQWNNVRQASAATYFSFQAVLSRDGTIQFNYDGAMPAAAINSSTVGVKTSGTTSVQRLVLNQNGTQSLGTLVGPNQSTRLTPTLQPDYYSISLSEGDSTTLALEALPSGTLYLSLMDSLGNVWASGLALPTNFDLMVRDFRAPATGVYYVAVTSYATTNYSLLVTRNLTFDQEGNGSTSAATPLQSTPVAGARRALGYIDSGSAVDLYSITLAEGAMVNVATSTPGGDSGQFANVLNPRLRLLNSSGSPVVSDDNSAADGRNSNLTYSVPPGANGTYFIEVASSNSTVGEYILEVSGADASPFQITSTAPADNATLATSPATITVNFNDYLLVSSVQAGDLQIDGVPASDVVFVDSDTLNFTVPGSLSEGLHSVTFAAGSILDLQGTTLSAYNGTLGISAAAPRVIGTSLAPNSTIAPGSLTYQVTFNEAMRASSLTSDDVTLRGNHRAQNYIPSNLSLDATGTILTLNYANLPDDDYTLTLLSGGTAFADSTGVSLDGEFNGTFPSGNGIAGGNFVTGFKSDYGAEPFATFNAASPLGSLVYEGAISRTIISSSDIDTFTFAVAPGQTITVAATPTSGLLPTVELRDSANATMGTATSVAGRPAILNTLVATGGTYTIRASGASSSVGMYTLQVTLNAAYESNAVNQSRASAQPIDASFLNLQTSLASGQRGAVVGVLENSPILDFESGTMPSSISTYSSSIFGRIQVTAPGSTLNSSSFALIMDSSSIFSALNEAVYTFDLTGVTQATLNFSHVSFSDETDLLPTNFSGHANGDGVAISADGVNWRTILNAPSTSTWTPVSMDLVAAAAAANMTVGPNFRIKFQQYDNGSVPSDGRGYDNISVQCNDDDWYRFDLQAGDRANLALNLLGAGAANVTLTDSAGVVLATGAVGPSNIDQYIANFTAPANGTYYARVIGSQNLKYDLTVVRNAVFNAESNETAATAQSLGGNHAALGHVASGTDEDWYFIQLPANSSVVQLETRTPGDDLVAFANTLDVLLELYDASGLTLLGTGSSLADGRNKSLQVGSLVPGASYQVRVAGLGGTRGEYFLTAATPPDSSAPAPTLTPGNGTLNYVENEGPHTIDANFVVSDADSAELVSATISFTGGYVGGQDVLTFVDQNGIHGVFSAGNGTLALTGNATLANYQTALRSITYTNNDENPSTANRTLSILVDDGVHSSAPATRTITVTAINDAPIVSANQSFSINENSGNGSIVGAVSGTDVDGSIFSNWTITSGNTGGAFAIISSDGTLTVANGTALNREAIANFTLQVTVSDGVSTSAAQNITINLNDVNDIAPVIAANQTFALNENSGNGLVVGTVSASDGDVTPTTYSNWTITSGNTGGAFSINSSNGTLTVANGTALNREAIANFTLQVTVSDGVNTSAAQNITINLTDVNDIAPVIVANQTFVLNENSGNGLVVGIVSASDGDVTPTTYSNWTITGGNAGGAFSVNATTGQVTVANSTMMDREARSNFTLQVTVSDGVNTSSTQNVTINLNDVNDVTPVITANQTFTLNENSANTTVLGPNLTAVDGDVTPTTFQSWSITGGNTGGAFAINATTGQLTVANSTMLDREARSIFTLQVAVSDGVNISPAQNITIQLNDVNDVVPAIGANQTFTLNENSGNGLVVGTVSASDGDVSPTTYSNWTIIAGNINGAFAINAGNGTLTVANGTALNREAIPSISLRLSVSDGVQTSAGQNITINLNDVNDVAPVVTANQTFSLNENSGNGVVVGAVSASDGDVTPTTYSNWSIVSGNTNGAFALNSSNGALTVANGTALDREAIANFTLRVTVSDGVNTSAAQNITINLNDINDVTPVVATNLTFTLPENSSNGVVVGNANATDGDVTSTVFSNWTITSGNTNGAFSINATTGQIRVANSTILDREAVANFTLAVAVSDGVRMSSPQNITVNLSEVNDVTPVIGANQTFTLAENSSNGILVGSSLTATDGDMTATAFSNWTITAGNTGGAFAINATTGQLRVANGTLLDREATASFTLRVTVSDGVQTSAAQNVTINLTDVNDVTPVVAANQTFTLPENSGNGSVVGSLNASDGDVTPTSFSNWIITSGNSGGAFSLNATTGQLSVANSTMLDRETAANFTLRVTVSDGIRTSNAQNITINLSDVNDIAPVVTANQSFALINTSANGAFVGNILATDGDVMPTTFSNWTLTGGNTNGAFALNAATGQLTVANSIALVGSFALQVTVSDGVNTSAVRSVSVNTYTPNNVAPVFVAGNLTFSYGVVANYATLSASDADPLTYSAVIDSVGHYLQSTYNLTYDPARFNYGGQQDKWFTAPSGNPNDPIRYFILPSGDFFQWNRSTNRAQGTLITTVSPAYYNQPTRMGSEPAGSGPLTFTANGPLLSFVNPGRFEGQFRVTATVSDGVLPVTKSFFVNFTNLAPTFAPIANLTMPPSQDTIATSLSVLDLEGDAFTYNATVQSQAQSLDGFYNFTAATGPNNGDLRLNQRWLYSPGSTQSPGAKYFYLLPNGDLFQWDGTPYVSQGTFLANVGTNVYATPNRLVNPITAATLAVNGNLLTVDPSLGFVGTLFVTATATDARGNSASQSFTVTVAPKPTLTQPADRNVASAAPIQVPLAAIDPSSLPLSYRVTNEAAMLQATYGLSSTGAVPASITGARWMVGAGSGVYYYLLANGELHRYDTRAVPAQKDVLVRTLDPRYYVDTSLLTNASTQATFSVAGSILTITPRAGFHGKLVLTVYADNGVFADAKTFTVSVA